MLVNDMNNDRSIDDVQMKLYNDRKVKVRLQGKAAQEEEEEVSDDGDGAKNQKQQEVIKDIKTEPQKQRSGFFACCGPREIGIDSDGDDSDEE